MLPNLVNKETGYYKAHDGTNIYYEVHGDGAPIIFIYGIACLMNHWHHQVNYLSKSFKVITFDLRGHHKSSPLISLNHLKMTDFAKDIRGLVDHLKLKKVHFAGHSFGVPIMLQLFDESPDVFKSATFINGFAKNPIKNMFGLNVIEPFYYFFRSQYELQPDLLNTLWKLAVDNPISMYASALAGGFNINLTHFKDIEVYARGVAHMDLKMFLILFEELMSFDGTEILEKINIPSLIISGEKDSITPRSFQLDFHHKIKGSEFIEVKYGSHCTQLDFPEFINLKLEKFLTSIKSVK